MKRSQKSRRRAISSAERRRRDELSIPLEVGRLEERRVLSHTAPTLTGANALTGVTQGGANGGTLVSALIAGKTTGGLGIAITGINNGGGGSNGTWWYKTPAGSFTQFPTPAGGLSDTNALLLDDADLVRFVPNSGFTGTASITFRAWDQSTGADTNVVDVSTNGGGTAFSSSAKTSSVGVAAPAGPSLANVGGGGTTSILDDQTTKPFNNSANQVSFIESDVADTLTVTVTLQDANADLTDGNGSLAGGGFTKSGVGTYTLSNVTAAQASTDVQALVFTPSSGSPGVTVDTAVTVTVTDLYSQSTVPCASALAVTGNTTPTLTNVPTFASIPGTSTSSTVDGTQISAILAGNTNSSNNGIAITGVDNSFGLWEWSPNNTPNSWTDLTGETASSAFLLSKNDYLRFVPNGVDSGTATISFVAWDMSVGTLHGTFDTTQAPGSGGFSSPIITDSIIVEPIISISGTGTSYALTTNTPTPFQSATIADSDSADTVTITITQQFGNGPTDTLFANGVLSSPNIPFTSASHGVYTISNVSIATAEADLQAMTFSPAAGTPGTTRTTKFGIVVADSFGSANSASDDATILVVASPPLLTGVTDFSDIPANSTSASMAVSTLITATPSTSGAAVVSVDDSNGTWQYNNGTGWNAIPTAISTSQAFLLASTDDVRFVSTTGIGNSATITLLAWDGASGTEGHTFDTTAPSTAGGFSTNEKDAIVTMYPVLGISGTGTVNTSLNQTITPFAAVSLADSDSGDTVTITITQLTGGATDSALADGTLSSSGPVLSEAAGVYTLSGISEAEAQADLRALTFTPVAGTPGTSLTTSFQIQLSDNFDPLNTVTTTPGTAPKNERLIVKSPPVLNGANNFPAEDAATVTGMQVSSLIYNPDQVADPSDTSLGIAVTAVTGNTTDGQWEWATTNSTNNANWHNLSGGGPTSAFLLASTDFIRFVPNAGFSGTDSITFLAWDGTSGTLHNTADTTVAAGSGAFSSGTAPATASITVAPLLTISGTGTVDTSLNQTITPFGAVSLADSDSSDTVTITITQIAGGATDASLANGSLSSSGAVLSEAGGVYTLSGISEANAQADLRALIFTPVAGTPGTSLTTSFQIQLSDGSDPTNTVTTTAGIAPTNEVLVVKSPPVLNGANPFPNEDSGTVTGMQVSQLLLGQTVDPSDPNLGIAVTAVTGNTTDGQWEWATTNSTNNSNWHNLSGGGPTSAFLLASTDFIRFVPNTNFSGTDSITFLAWDGTSGTLHNTADTTVAAGSGAFSSGTAPATASITVDPLLSISGTGTVNASLGQTITPFAAVSLADSDSSDTVTITITQITGGATDASLANGSLSSSGAVLSEAGGVYTLSGISEANVQADLRALIFTPVVGTPGASLTTSFQIQVSDGSDPTNTVTTTVATPPTNEVLVVKSPPILNGANNFPSEDSTTVTGTQVSALIAGQTNDPSDTTLGIAVVGVTDNNSTDGQWQWATTNSTNNSDWTNITVTGATSSLLLANTDYVRFVPKAGFSGTPTITFLAWDGSSGTQAHVDTTYDSTTPASLGAFSSALAPATSSILVNPVLTISGTGTTMIHDDQQTTPFDNGLLGTIHATVNDSTSADTVTVTIVQQFGGGPSSGATDSLLTMGTLSGTGLTNNGDGTYTLTGTAAAVTTELQALQFTPNPAPAGPPISTVFKISVADGTATVKTDSGTVLDIAHVPPPTLTGSNNLPPIIENVSATNDAGIAVSSLPATGSSPGIGIAVSAVEDSVAGTTIGTWQYSTNGTAASPTWIDLPTALSLTPPGGGASAAVFLLAPTDFVRFVPAAGFTGTSTITYVAWNQDTGIKDQVNDPTNPLLQLGLSAPSATSPATASVTVYPVLTIGTTQVTTSLDDQTSTPFSTATIGNTLSTETMTVTITQQQSLNGVATTDSGLLNGSLSGAGLSYAGNGVYTLSGTAAQVTAALQSLVFSPSLHEVADGQTVVTKFQIVASDATFAPINTVTDSGTKITVTANAAPVLGAATNNLPPLAENVATGGDSGVAVSSLVSGATDADGNPIGIAISAVDSSKGEWDYSTGTGQPWIPISGVSSTTALLLAPTDRVRFLPAANAFGTATIKFQAWDGTVGTATNTFDPTASPGSGAFSSVTTSTVQVVAPATIFASTPAVATNDETPITVFAAGFGSQLPGSPAPGITDPNTPTQNYTVTIAISATANGTFENATPANGWTSLGGGMYRFSGTAAAANAALEALSFVPTAHQVQPSTSVGTSFTITVNDGITTPTTLNTIVLTVTAVNDPPTFGVSGTNSSSLPVLAANGAAAGTNLATDVDANSNIIYSITGGNTAGIYTIDGHGKITVANNAGLTFSSTPTVLSISAVNIGADGVASTAATSTRTIYLWAVTASATPISTSSETTLTLSLLYPSVPSPPPLTVGPLTVAWSDGTTSTATLTSTHPTASLDHFYATNPNKADPAAPIPINVTGANVVAQTTAAVSGTGVGIAVIPDTQTSFVALIAVPALEAPPVNAVIDQQVTEAVDTGVAQSQTTTNTAREVYMQIVPQEGAAGDPIPLRDDALNDLPSLFKKLPDGHYQVYLKEDGHQRLVIDVVVRQGRPVDSADDSGGAGDRPPTSQSDADIADGFTKPGPSAPKLPAATALEKQPAKAAGAAAPGATNPSPPPSGSSPGATQTPPPSNPAAPPNGTPTIVTPTIVTPTAADTKPESPGSARPERWAAWTAAGFGVAASAAIATNPQRTDELMERLTKRALSKSARLSRWLRKSANVE